MASEQTHFWLWMFTVATAVVGGALSLWGAALQRRAAGDPAARRKGDRFVMASYVLMSASIATFVVRGFV